MKKIVIAIDGYSACGKSTTAKAVAKALNYIYADSGAMYRAVTYYLIKENIDLNDIDQVRSSLNEINIEFKVDLTGAPITYLNGDNVEEVIRTMDVSQMVSAVAAISEVRRAMVELQQKMGRAKGVVMDGRDIGTVVFPEAELKIFMTADPMIRAKRRLLEMEQKGLKTSLEDVLTNLAERDHLDTTREDSPLEQAKDAVVIDNSYLTFDEQVAKIVELAKNKITH